MNSLEHQQLTTLLQRLSHVQLQQKDSEAIALVREACARQPDVAYLMAQQIVGQQLLGQAGSASCFDCAPPEGSYAFEAAGIPLPH